MHSQTAYSGKLLLMLSRAMSHSTEFNGDKFQFRVSEVKYMGLIISERRVKTDKSHLSTINELYKLINKKD